MVPTSKISVMKKYSLSLLTLLVAMAMPFTGWSQYDDLYYNPDKQTKNTNFYNPDQRSDYGNYDNYDDDSEWDESEYEYFDEYDYNYSSRIRRFHRPMRGFDYYSDFYTDIYFYDPWAWNTFGPGTNTPLPTD